MKIYKAKDNVKSDPIVKPGDLFYICRDMNDPRLVPIGSTNGLGISLNFNGHRIDLEKFFEVCDNKSIDDLPYLRGVLDELNKEREELETQMQLLDDELSDIFLDNHKEKD